MANTSDELSRLITQNTLVNPNPRREERRKVSPYEFLKLELEILTSWYIDDFIIPVVRNNKNAVRGSKILLKDPQYAFGGRAYDLAKRKYGIYYVDNRFDWDEREPTESKFMPLPIGYPSDGNDLFLSAINARLASSNCEVKLEEKWSGEVVSYKTFLHIS